MALVYKCDRCGTITACNEVCDWFNKKYPAYKLEICQSDHEIERDKCYRIKISYKHFNKTACCDIIIPEYLPKDLIIERLRYKTESIMFEELKKDMKKFKVTDMLVEHSINGITDLKIKVQSDGGFTASDASKIRETIDNINTPDYAWYCGRGNGKTLLEAVTAHEKKLNDEQKYSIKQVILHNPATIIFWADGTKTVVKCQNADIYDPEVGIAMCFMKKALGNKSNFNNTFKKHIPMAVADNVIDNFKIATKKIKELSKKLGLKDTTVRSKKSTKTYAHLDTELIYRILREHKWTTKEFANYVGVDVTSVYAWLRGNGIKKRTLNKLSKVLHIPEEDLVK